MYLKLRLTCLNDDLLLLGWRPGTWRCLNGHLSEHPSPQVKTLLWLQLSLVWLSFPKVVSKALKSLISHPDLANNSNFYIQLPTDSLLHDHNTSSLIPLLHLQPVLPSLCLPPHNRWNFHPPRSSAKSIGVFLDFSLSFIQPINMSCLTYILCTIL